MIKKEWNNYFGTIENKYNLKLNTNYPIVIFLDGKGITKSLNHDLISETKDSFNDILEQTVKYFTSKFNCIAISGVDEVSFLIEDVKKFKNYIGAKNFKAHDIVSIFSQYFYEYFNDRYSGEPIYWHCKFSNIPKGKIKSYIKYRSLTIHELKLTYFFKRKQFKNAGKISLATKQQKSNEMADYAQIKEFEKGKLYINGNLVALDAFLNNQIVKLPETQREESNNFLNITDF